MKLEYSFSYSATLKDPLMVGPGPFGSRMVFEVTGGNAEGPEIKGEILTGGADWLLVGPDGWGRLDVRAQLVTDDGATIYLHYTGVLEMNEKVQAKLTDPEVSTDYREHYFRTMPCLETGDPRYAWVNHTVFVAEGRLGPGNVVAYRVYRVA